MAGYSKPVEQALAALSRRSARDYPSSTTTGLRSPLATCSTKLIDEVDEE